MKIYRNIYISLLVLFFSLTVFLCTLYNFGLSKVSNDDTLKKIVIEPGSIDSIAVTLYNNNMIRSKLAFNIYVRLNNKTKLMAATYNLSESMGIKKIVDILNKGESSTDEVKITFKEGLNMRNIAKVIAENTNNNEDDVYNLLNDENYLDHLIDKYWFLSNDIKNDKIYYPLEGYLYPNTYSFTSRDATIKEIFEKMLDETNIRLSQYRGVFEKKSLSVHETITLASIVELEGVTLDERRNIAGVFFNRMNDNINLGSDVTTYYGAKVDMGERDLLKSEVNECNNYNTRCVSFKKLPVSAICNPSIEAIEAVLSPANNDYYYFVADKNKKIYFSKDQAEHNKIINKLKKANLWYEY